MKKILEQDLISGNAVAILIAVLIFGVVIGQMVSNATRPDPDRVAREFICHTSNIQDTSVVMKNGVMITVKCGTWDAKELGYYLEYERSNPVPKKVFVEKRD